MFYFLEWNIFTLYGKYNGEAANLLFIFSTKIVT
jgi:hypothetical protein